MVRGLLLIISSLLQCGQKDCVHRDLETFPIGIIYFWFKPRLAAYGKLWSLIPTPISYQHELPCATGAVIDILWYVWLDSSIDGMQKQVNRCRQVECLQKETILYWARCCARSSRSIFSTLSLNLPKIYWTCWNVLIIPGDSCRNKRRMERFESTFIIFCLWFVI